MPIPCFSLHTPVAEIREALGGVPAEAKALIPAALLAEISAISMLHEDALTMMALLASRSEGPILEVGPYTGGSTAALCAGAKPGVRIATIELGGAHPTHPSRPSHDIVGDLRTNLARLGIADRVAVINRAASSPLARREARVHLGDDPIGLFVVDADGHIDRHLGFFAGLLRDDCLLVADDYIAEGAVEKQAFTKPWIDERVRRGLLREFGVFGWGTWFGQIAGPEALAEIRAGWSPFVLEGGHCFLCEVVLPAVPDTMEHPSRSPLRLIERSKGGPGAVALERELGPAHATHDDIRRLGGGRFSHWSASEHIERGEHVAHLFLSTSDNSDPLTNGRSYSVVVGGRETRLDLA